MNRPHMACASGIPGKLAQFARPSNPSGKSLFFLLRKSLLPAALFTAFFAADASATNYYVDSQSGNNANNGTSTSTPWQTLTNVNATMFAAGDNVYFKRGGVWNGTLYPKIDVTNINAGIGTSPTNRITFDAYGPLTDPKPQINGNGAKWAVQIVNKQYFTFQNFHITNTAAADGVRMGIRVAFGGDGTPLGSVYQFNDVKILNNDISDVRGITVRAQGIYDQSGGIYVELMDYKGSQTRVDSLLIEGNYFYNNRCIGLHVKAPGNYNGREDLWATNLKIRCNIFDGTGADHIVLNGATGAFVEYNAGYDAGISTLATPDPDCWIAGMWSAYHTRDITFQYNEVARTRNNILNGIKGDSQAFDADLGTRGNQVFQYNYTHENEGGVFLLMPDDGVSKVAFYRYNLSVNDGRKTFTGCQFAMNPNPGESAAYVYNNVFYSTRPEGFRMRDYAGAYYYNNVFHVTSAIYPTAPVFSNNAYYGHMPDVNDPYKVVADPKFAGPLPGATANDGYTSANTQLFKIQSNSPLINAGMAIPSLGIGTLLDNGSRDFWGNPLYAGGHADIGAHEYVGGSAAAPAAVARVDNTAGASVAYTGPWTHVTNDENAYLTTKSTAGVGAYVQHTFTGTNVGVYGAKGPNMGKVSLNVDNGTSVLVDCYWPVPLHRVLLHHFTGLANTAHTLRGTVMAKNPASSSNLVVIDYFQQNPVAPPTAPVVTTIDAAPGAGVVYNGSWTHFTADAAPDQAYYGKTRSVSSTVGAYVDFTFTGTGVRLIGTKGGDFGKINVSVNGGAATSVNCYQGLITEFQRHLFEVNNLTPGTHTLRVTVAAKDPASTANTIALDLIQAIGTATVGGADIIKDNTDAGGITISGAWSSSVSVPGFLGTDYVSSPAGSSNTLRYTPTIPTTGTYEVFARWTQLANRASAVPYEITSASGTVTVSKDQRAQGSQWVSLGLYPFNAGTTGNVLIRSTATDGYTIADGVRFTQQSQGVEIVVDASDPTGVTKVGAWTGSTTTAGYHGADALNDGNTKSGTQSVQFTPTLPSAGTYEVFAWWPAATNRSPSVPFKVTHAGGNQTVNVDQRINGSQWYSLGTYTFNAGTTGNVLVTNAYTGPLPVPSQCYVITDAVRFVRQ
ncbi:hypothetical protein [Rariglobus hedericola]|uniref:Golvesin/Xly CBD-like domain-containing protein n=1 Tax=Rariglobus hedericola TaxID=2597822 RepID=A0A556QPK2_9BACT|nr:hypothetical protein [Rariglobus hedericola]TSJ78565.1 hypothetical protein FPL22_04495 [Rariglobus hedericola]